jgi:outer membrane protein assembly factor BamB
MARAKTDVLYIGIGGHAAAIDAATGSELWRTKLKTAPFVTVQQAGGRLCAGAGGELFCLDVATGQVLWRNRLKGLGTGLIAFTCGSEAASAAALQAQEAAVAASAATCT